jgi:hypothetical protein
MKHLFTFLFATSLLFAFSQSCGENFYDSGGLDTTYMDNEIDTIVICPQNGNESVIITFTNFYLEQGYDFLTIYNGSSVSDSLIGSYTGTDNPGTIIAENPSGCITFVFTSDVSVTYDGWEATISCVPLITCYRPTNFMFDSLTNSSVNLSWTAGTENEWLIEYGPNNFTLGTGTSVVTTSNPFEITGLNGNTNYDFYVKAICGAGDSSMFTNKISIVTLYDTLTCGDTFFDPGGEFGDYSLMQNDTITICPSDSLETIQITFSALSLGNNDFLMVYNGDSVNAPLMNTFTDTTFESILIAENLSGCLTFVFSSDNFGTSSGWAASISCIPALTCFKPIDLNAINITNDTVDLSWSSQNGETEWQVEYGLTNFVLGTGTIVNTNSNPIQIIGLQGATNYDFYVRSICSAGDSSFYAGPFTFQTALNPFICGNQFIDNGGMNNYALNSIDTIVICPSNVNEAVQITFSEFNIENGYDFLTVFNGDSFSSQLIGTYTDTVIPNTFTAENTSGCLTFLFQSDDIINAAGWIADISCVPQTNCFPPNQINVNNVTNNSAQLSWTAGNNETEWIIEYGLSGFNLGSGTQIQTSENPYVLTNLTGASGYQFYIQSFCNSSDSSSFVGPISFQTDLDPLFCGSVFTDNGGDTTYNVNSNDTIVICPTSSNEAVQVIFSEFDLEFDYDFLTVYNGNSMSSEIIDTYTGTSLPGTITAVNPDGCLTFHFTSDGSVENAGWLAQINCVPNLNCPNPTEISSSNITSNSALISWTQAASETQYIVEYGISGFTLGTGTTLNVSTIEVTLSSLEGFTTYDVYIKSVCEIGDSGLFSLPISFTTLGDPLVCGNQFYDNNGPNMNYDSTSTYPVTICPTSENDVVQIEFSAFSLSNTDTLFVYDGISTNSNLLASLTGNSVPNNILATNNLGCLTFQLQVNSLQMNAGWEALINCVEENGIFENKFQNIKVYPNPTKDIVTIENKSLNNLIIRITDLQGKELNVNLLNNNIISNSTQKISLENFEKGLYFITIDNGVDIKVYSLIKE